MKKEKQFSPFEKFTNLYSLSKTLRFELRPRGKTLENMRIHLEYDKGLQIFMKDQKIEDAYQTLKPVMDKIHEKFITDSLGSAKAKNIDFSGYLEKYRQKDKKEISDTDEKKLRAEFAQAFQEVAKKIKDEYKNIDFKTGLDVDTEDDETDEDNKKKGKKKGLFKKENQEILTESAILRYIEINIDKLIDNEQEKEKIKDALLEFKRFFTYFGGFNQNRENYYETGKEAETAVATRIVHENLPKFCDNLIQFDCIIKKKKDGAIENIERRSEYLNAYKYLKSAGKITQIKDAESGKMIEADSIVEDIFKISYFSSCLSQGEIEEYNRIIGHYNLLINLYNQAKRGEEKYLEKNKKTFQDLPTFKTLWKQIGCREKDPLFFSLTYYTKKQAEENKENYKKPYSVEQILEQAKIAGEKYFKEKSDDGIINTIPEFLEYLQTRENYDGIYWSKVAMNTISNKYFANYHDLKDRLKTAKVFQKASKGSEEDIKIPEAIELEGLFTVIDQTEGGWQAEGVFFKKSLTEKLKEESEESKKRTTRRSIVAEAGKPSEALMKMIFDDISDETKQFLDSVGPVLALKNYESKESIEMIKRWMDHSLAINRMLKYFLVKANKVKKVKGAPIDPILSEALNVLLRADDAEWFKWYDALRNYLTKKPQDDAKENKLKLNFECPSLLGGFSDGQEKNKATVILKKYSLYYLGILKKKNLFDTERKNNEVYQNTTSNYGRLILANLKFQTLAGRGFIRDYQQSYGEMGKKNPMKAVRCLQELILKQYVKKYSPLRQIAEKAYENKKNFDKDVQNALKEGYICEFTPINWDKVEEHTNNGEMYLFQIYSKDLAKGSTGNKDLQMIYWNTVLEENSSFQLNGGGEIFYRKLSIKEQKIKIGYEKKPWVIENRRFTNFENDERNKGFKEDEKIYGKFLFHCPIKLNYKSKSYSDPKYALPEINKLINENFSSTHFLGIDRGEKHLAYYCLINQNGKIVAQDTLNLPFTDKDGRPRSIKKEKFFYDKESKGWKPKEVDCWDYNDLLDARASNRDMARKNWQTIGTIKELKEGYISQVVRKIADLATDKGHPAFIVLEDLNTGFKRERQKIEKSIYQKLEVALAKKLNFLVDKNANIGEIGSVTNAIQLTPPVNNYKDIENKKQLGIMLYTRANYTSQTDPVTGWRKTIYLKTGSEGNIKQQIIEAFSEIIFDGKDYVFTYTDKNTSKEWKLYSGKDGKSLDRFRGERGKEKNEWQIKKIDVVEILNGIFISFNKNKSLLDQIKAGTEPVKINEHTAWESFRFAIELVQQIRNTGLPEDKRNSDFLQSPVRSEEGEHFDSHEYWDKEQKGEKVDMPSSGDANGAFNIARKGLLMNEHIKTWIENGKPKYDKQASDLNLFISETEWDLYLTNRKEWKKQLLKFSSRKMAEANKKTKPYN